MSLTEYNALNGTVVNSLRIPSICQYERSGMWITRVKVTATSAKLKNFCSSYDVWGGLSGIRRVDVDGDGGWRSGTGVKDT
jgi:hypothetical protein